MAEKVHRLRHVLGRGNGRPSAREPPSEADRGIRSDDALADIRSPAQLRREADTLHAGSRSWLVRGSVGEGDIARFLRAALRALEYAQQVARHGGAWPGMRARLTRGSRRQAPRAGPSSDRHMAMFGLLVFVRGERAEGERGGRAVDEAQHFAPRSKSGSKPAASRAGMSVIDHLGLPDRACHAERARSPEAPTEPSANYRDEGAFEGRRSASTSSTRGRNKFDAKASARSSIIARVTPRKSGRRFRSRGHRRSCAESLVGAEQADAGVEGIHEKCASFVHPGVVDRIASPLFVRSQGCPPNCLVRPGATRT